MKSILTPLLCLTLAIGLIFSYGCERNPEESVIKIGILTPLTGEGATYGEATKRGIEIALRKINETGGVKSKKLVAIYEDTQLDPNSGTKAIQKLIQVEKVPVILGPFGSSVVLAVANIANNNKVPILSASATADAIRESGDYVFRIVPPNSAQGKTMADFVVSQLGIKEDIVVYAMNNDYGLSLADSFQNRIVELNGKVLFEEKFNPGEKDFRTTLQKIKSFKPKFIFLPDHYSEAGLILRQAKELGLSAYWGGGDGSYSPELVSIAEVGAEGFYLTLMGFDYGTAENKTSGFTAEYQKLYGSDPDVYSAYAHDAVYVIAEAVKRVIDTGEKLSGTKIKDALYQIDYLGITGVNKFDDNGEVSKPYAIYVIKDGKFVRIKTTN